ncbi:MAG: site-2 protease family protein [Proteobacteria bacterium]|nr:site-2 protease family protein [Pseudomonadota bacterium]
MGNLSGNQIAWVLIGVLVLIVSVALHEFGHAFMADRLGDDTPRRQGRVTLNPIAHIDPIGTLLLPLIGGLHGAAGGRGGGFGWGKPVQWQPSRIRRGVKMTTASILVALAGPAMNIVLAVLVSTTQVILAAKGVIHPDRVLAQVVSVPFDPDANAMLSQILTYTVITNFVLFFFNLIPAPPLDGGHVLQNLLPRRYLPQFEQYARFGPFVVLAIAMIPVLAQIFTVPAMFCAEHLYKALGSIFG